MRFLFFLLCAVICCLANAGITLADQRSDAMTMLAKLRQDGIANRLPDEMRSLDATLATAEMYHHLNDQKNAERYYQLAIQKGEVIQQRLLVAVSAPKSTTPKPEDLANEAATGKLENSPLPPSLIIQKPVSSSTIPTAPLQQQTPTLPKIELEQPFISARLIGTTGTYTVAKGDTLRLVAAKLGVSRTQLSAMNGLKQKDPLRIGQALRYSNQRIIPSHKIRDGIVINIPDRMLYLFQNSDLVFSAAVALGTPTKTDQFVWETPVGKFKIVNKTKDPTWTVPPSIQEEMRLSGKEVITSIPPGKDNPLGKYAMKTSLPGILIHSTTKPWSIYTYSSHGCIRVYPERMEELFKLVKTNTAGEIIYKPVKLAVTDDGRILLEAHRDIYNKTQSLLAEARALIREQKLDLMIDWEKVKQVISRKAGVAEEITQTVTDTQHTVDASRSQSPS